MHTPPFAHELKPGDTYVPLRFTVTAEMNEQFLFALADYGTDYVGAFAAVGAKGGAAIVHPVLLLHMSARTRSPSFRLAPRTGSVFARDIANFHHPALVQEELEVRWTIRDVYARKGRLYQALETTVHVAASAEPVLLREAHSLFFTDDGLALPVPVGATSGAERSAPATVLTHSAALLPSRHPLPIGEVIQGRALMLSAARVLAFSGGGFDELPWPHANLHTNLDRARDAGLDAIIASGTQSEGLLLGTLIDVFGPVWHRAGRLEVRFLKPVRVGTEVRPMLRVTGHEPLSDATMRIVVECWCESRGNERVIEGTASCVVMRARSGTT